MCGREKWTMTATTAMKNKLMLAPTQSSSESEPEDDDEEGAETLIIDESNMNDHQMHMPSNMLMKRKTLSKQLSMKETCREAKWEHRRRQIINRRRRMMMMSTTTIQDQDHENENGGENIDVEEEGKKMRGRVRSLTDEDLDELRGSIDLGFGFNEDDGGHQLCDTLPALNLYFAVNRQFSDPMLRSTPSPASTPMGKSSSSECGCETSSPSSPQDDPQMDWKIVNPGDDPQHVKTRLRHWAQAVACSVRQSG